MSKFVHTEIASALALLCEKYPKCFVMFERRRRPLKIGIHKELPEGLIEPTLLKPVFRNYVNNSGYLLATRLGVPRIGLDGEPAGVIDEADVKNALARLDEIRKRKAQRRREEAPVQAVTPPPQPPRRDGLEALRAAGARRRTNA